MGVGNEIKSTTWRGRVNRYAPFLFWAMMILIFSSSTGSAENTSRFIRPILEFVFYSASPTFIDSIHFLIRKSAHFIFYGVLSVLAFRTFVGSSRPLLASRPFISALLATMSIALLDEFNQSLNPSRTGSPQDVILDLAGAISFLTVALLIRRHRGE
jgi:VanZ family protein